MVPKQKFVEGDHVRVKDYKSSGLWEIYSVQKVGKNIRYSLKRLEATAITLFCNVQGKKLDKVEKK